MGMTAPILIWGAGAIGGTVGAWLVRLQSVDPLGFNGYDPAAFAKDVDATGSFDAMVAHNRTSAKSHSGIWRDLAVRKRKTEVDPQLTLPLSIGKQMGHPMPLTARLIALVQEIETGQRPLSLETPDALKHTYEDNR
jgi:2-dehydropantoate 2-reductase